MKTCVVAHRPPMTIVAPPIRAKRLRQVQPSGRRDFAVSSDRQSGSLRLQDVAVSNVRVTGGGGAGSEEGWHELPYSPNIY